MRTVTTISSAKRASEARRARRAVPLVTRALFQHLSGTNVPLRGYAPRSPRSPRSPHSPRSPRSPHSPRSPRSSLAPASPQPRPSLAPASPQPRPEISHVIRLLDTSTTAKNVAITTSGFQYLKDVRGNYVRDCWETTAQRPPAQRPPTQRPSAQRGRDRKARPRPRRDSRTNQMRKGSFLTSPKPFHHAPRPSVSPALVSGIRMRTSA